MTLLSLLRMTSTAWPEPHRRDAAQKLLAKNGELFPFGVTLTANGDQRLVPADPRLGERPESQAVIDAVHAGFPRERASLSGAAFVSDVRVDGFRCHRRAR